MVIAPPRSLRSLLPALVVAFALLAGLANLGLELSDVRRHVTHETVQDLRAVGTQLQGNLARFYRRGDGEGVVANLAWIMTNPLATAAVVVDPRQVIIAGSRARWRDQTAAVVLAEAGLPLPDSAGGEPISAPGGGSDLLVGAFPIEPGAGEAGTVNATLLLYFSMSRPIAAARKECWDRFGSFALALCGIAALLGVLLNRLVSDRAGQLVAQARAIARGDFAARTRFHGRDELCALSDAVNQMGGRLQENYQSLVQAREEYANLIENSNDLIHRMTLDGSMLFVNRTWAHLGYDPATIRERSFLGMIHPDHRESMRRTLALIREGHTSGPIRSVIMTRGGEPRQIEGRLSPNLARGSDGTFYGYFRDVTEQYRAEAESRRVTTLLQSVLREMPDAIFAKDLQGRYMLFNPAAAEFVGRPVEEVLGRDDKELFDAGSAAYIQRVDREIIERGVGSTHEERITAAGMTRTYLATKVPLFDSERRVAGLLGISRDITDRVEAERRYRQITELSPVGVFRTDPTGGSVVYLNPRMAEMIGCSLVEAMGEGWRRHLHPDDLGPFQEAWQAFHARTVDGGPAVAERFRTEHRFLLPGGGTVWVLGQVAPEWAENGELLGWIGSLIDITDRKQAELRLREQESQYRAAIETTQDGFMVLDPHGAIREVNELYCRLSGYERRELLAMRIHQLDAALPAGQVDEVLEYLRHHGSDRFETQHRRRDGGEWPAEISTAFSAHGAGSIFVFVRDLTRKREADRQLQLLKTCVSRLNDIVVITEAEPLTDPGPRIVFVNDSFERVTGYRREEALGRSPRLLQGPGTNRTARERIAAALKQWKPVREELLNYTKSGEEIWLELDITPVFREDGFCLNWVAVERDITERKRAEAALRESEGRFRVLADAAPIIIWMTDPQGGCASFNQRWTEFTGRTMADDLGWGWEGVVHPDDLGAFTATYRRSLEAREPFTSEVRLRNARGEYRWVRSEGVPRFGPAGEFLGYIGTSLDITERKRADDQVRAIMGSVTDGIIAIDSRGTILTVNAAAERLFGYSGGELIGQNVRVLVPAPHTDQHDGYLERYFRTGEERLIGRTRELPQRRKDGSVFPAELTVSAFELDGAKYIVGVVHDVTARKKLEELYRQSQKMEAIGQLAGGVAHDFNNLLTVINGFSDLMLSGMSAENPEYESLLEIREAGERAATLTAQLLAFSRKSVVEPVVMVINSVVESSAKMLRRLIGEDIALVTRLAAELRPVRIDPGHLGQVLLNLAVNARDAMPTGGRLTIETANAPRMPHHELDPSAPAHDGPAVLLSVADTGTGMSEEVKARIFEPFFTTKQPGKGTGLGLATVYGLVSQAGGHIQVESEPGRGTRFLVYLPAQAAPAGPQAADPASEPDRGSETVLLVEDEETVRRMAAAVLRSQGYAVLEAGTAADATDAADAHPGPIDLLLTDIVLPRASGRVLSERLRQQRPGIRVLFMSGYTDDAIVRHGIETATAYFLQKPFTPHQLIAQVRAVLQAPTGSAIEERAR